MKDMASEIVQLHNTTFGMFLVSMRQHGSGRQAVEHENRPGHRSLGISKLPSHNINKFDILHSENVFSFSSITFFFF